MWTAVVLFVFIKVVLSDSFGFLTCVGGYIWEIKSANKQPFTLIGFEMAEFGATKRDMQQRLPRATKVKNKQPADRQITAEQLLREAKEIQLEDDFRKPKTIINDPEELAEYRLKKRKEFEDMIRRVGRFNLAIWVKVRGQHEEGS